MPLVDEFRPFTAATWTHTQTPVMDASAGNDTASRNLSALGTLIGYVGAEAATVHLFERLLWPQRFWNRLTFRNAVLTALFMPMGGPLHKAALQTLDEFFAHGLFKGDRQGHMLGTAFFRDSKLGYTVWSGGEAVEKEFVRNGLWIRAIAQKAMPEFLPKADASAEAATASKAPPLRAKTSLSHLVLTNGATPTTTGSRPVVANDTAAPSAHVYAGVFLSELTGLAMGAIVACVWKSWIAALWFVPFILKLTSTIWAISREDLAPAPPASADHKRSGGAPEERTNKFEIHDPHHGLIVIEGAESVVLQFFRHYGHPARNRSREVLQFAVVVGLGLVFPAGLVVSVMCMPASMQYLWFGYQLYTTLTMHVYRYANTHFWGSTEQALGDAFECADAVELRGADGRVVTAALQVTYYGNLREAQQAALRLLEGPQPGSMARSDSDTTVVGDDEKELEKTAQGVTG
ncbi:hypothetical protein SLS58_008240 [Diplodia intermedia]|uniref:Uncharacterized protein n=1 Tax=Diplodia intermedia TaxID=856260 RepID=A0ABR3TI30_9PEZI